jgi:hypothetical protein
MREEWVRWGWPLAADAALKLGDHAEVRRLLDWLDAHPRGHIPPVARAERARIAAALLAAQHDGAAEQAYRDAVSALRALGSPYHLAVGLLDFADHLAGAGEPEQARLLATEATTIAERLGAQPLLRRANVYFRQAAPSS